jgi:hypothetical protein
VQLVALRGARARTRSTEDRVDMILVMEKEGHSDIERPIFYLRLTARL